jgi:hypothetical protein
MTVPSQQDEDLFNYQSTDVCFVGVQPVIWSSEVPDDARKLQRLSNKRVLSICTWYKIPRGYYRVIKGFLREIHLTIRDGVMEPNSLFRTTYLLKILDHFADELPEIKRGDEIAWRSHALNPLLQRQLRGLSDQDSTMKIQVGSNAGAAAEFYLTLDPLDPTMIPRLLRGILYIWPVRWSLTSLSLPSTQATYLGTLQNTEHILALRKAVPESEYNSVPLCPFEVNFIRSWGLEKYYSLLLSHVSGDL